MMQSLAMSQLSVRRRLWLVAGCGALTALGQAPVGLWPASLIGLAVAFAALRGLGDMKRSFWTAWVFGVAYFAVSLNWIVEPFLVDLARHGWMAPFGLVFMAGGMALFWGFAGGMTARLGSGAGAFVGSFAFAELLRSYIFTGFPWALIGHTLIDSPLAQWAAVAGAHGLTLIALAAAVWLVFLQSCQWRLAALGAVPLAGLLSINLWWAEAPSVSSEAPVLRLLQPNAPQAQKWDPDYVPIFFRRQIEAVEAEPRPDLILWPETAVPIFLEDGEQTLTRMATAADGVPMVFGVQRTEGFRYFNSAAFMDEAGQIDQVYDKHHLVPFGEYMPLASLLAKINIFGLAANEDGGFTAGPGPQLMDLGALGKALPLICYEAVFPQDVGGTTERPDFLMQITNDAWFGNFSGPYQHLAQARLRAIEQGLPMVRVANTGVSAVIDARGAVLDNLDLNSFDWLDAPLPPAMPETIYRKTGDIFPALAIILLLLSVYASTALKRGGKRIDQKEPQA